MYECRYSECTKSFTLHNNRSKHEKKCDKGIFMKVFRNLKCNNNWCEKEFTTKYNYERHAKICKEKTVFSCSKCSKTFASKSKCDRHEKVHDVKQMFYCQNCCATYLRKDKFEKHSESCNIDAPSSEKSQNYQNYAPFHKLSIF